MEKRFEMYGGLARIVWGTADDVDTHTSRLEDSLIDVDGFLATIKRRDYLKGPHRYFYMQLQKKTNTSEYEFNLDVSRPTVVHASRHVIKKVAERVVQKLLQPSLQADFGRLHKAIDGILFEEVCLYLIENHSGDIDIQVRGLNNKRTLTGYIKRQKLDFSNFKARKDVDFHRCFGGLGRICDPLFGDTECVELSWT
jgi:hypothetical protein